MKHLTILSLGLIAALTSCGDPTLAERLEGDWLLNDIVATGDIDFQGQTVSIHATDDSIASTSVFSLIKKGETQDIDAVIDASIIVTHATGFLQMPYATSVDGTWEVKDGGGATMDSLIIHEDDGTMTRYEIINLLQNSVKLRGLMDVDVQGSSDQLNFELNFEKL